MPVEVDLLEQAGGDGVLGVGLAATRRSGRSVNSMLATPRSMVAGSSALPVICSMPALTTCLRLGGSAAMASSAATRPLRAAPRRSAGARRGTRVRTTRCVVTNCPSGHSVSSSTSTVPPPSSTRRDGPRLGHPGAGDVAGLERLSVWAFSCGRIVTSPPPAASTAKPWSASQVRSATSWVLPVCGLATILPSSCAGVVMPWATTSDAPPEVAPATMRSGLAAGLGEGVDRRVRADEGGVERAGEQRLDGRGAGVEDLGVERGAAEGLGEEARRRRRRRRRRG